MFRTLAGPYRTAFIAMLAICILVGIWVVGLSGFSLELKIAFGSVFAVPLIYYFIFRTASAHFVRVTPNGSRIDLYGPFLNILCYAILFGIGTNVAEVDGSIPVPWSFILTPVFFLTFWALLAPFYIAGRKFTEVRGFKANFGASLGWGFVHYYWIIGFYWLLKHTRLDGPATPIADHP